MFVVSYFARSRIFLFFIFLLSCCRKHSQFGSLLISAPIKGHYEIYKIAQSSPLQIIAESIGEYNKALNLEKGYYLILADCSSKFVKIFHKNQINLNGYHIYFKPPIEVQEGDDFVIQCQQNRKIKLTQTLHKRFHLVSLNTKIQLRITGKPYNLNLKKHQQSETSQTFLLSALEVYNPNKKSSEENYFISSLKSAENFTISQKFGHKHFLLPGKYQVEVNNTYQDVLLKPGEYQKLPVAYLQIDVTSYCKNKPLFTTFSYQRKHMELGEYYAILPGKYHLQLEKSHFALPVEIQGGEFYYTTTRTLFVSTGCSPLEWQCIGAKMLFLYSNTQALPLQTFYSDTIIYSLYNKSMWLGIEGSGDIQYKISDKKEQKIQLGKLKLIPDIHLHPSYRTDLVRVETLGKNYRGVSFDVPLIKPSELLLAFGQYRLVYYFSEDSQQQTRKSKSKLIHISSSYKTKSIHFPVFLSSSQFKEFQQYQTKEKTSSERRSYRLKFYEKKFEIL